jgi:uncharacterized RDD family membrane protein YckC
MAAGLDTLLEVETPEGVHLNLRCAGMAPRMLAGLIDLMVLLLVWVGFSVVMMVGAMALGRLTLIVAMLVIFLLSWFYPAACEIFMDGQTIGKRAMGLRVMQTSGAPVTWRNSVVRSVLWSLDMFFCISLPVMLLGRDFRRVGDLAADTVVVYAEEKKKKSKMRKKIEDREEEREPVRLGRFSLEETQAIVAFAERRKSISDARQRELAGIVAAGFDADADEMVGQLRGHARYVQGVKR